MIAEAIRLASPNTPGSCAGRANQNDADIDALGAVLYELGNAQLGAGKGRERATELGESLAMRRGLLNAPPPDLSATGKTN